MGVDLSPAVAVALGLLAFGFWLGYRKWRWSR